MDSIDKKILQRLQSDSETPIADIASDVGVSAATCWRRIEALRRRGVILGRKIVLNEKSLNLGTVVFVYIRVFNHTHKWLKDFTGLIHRTEEIIECFRISGEFDYVCKIVVPSIDEYENVYKQLLPCLDGDQVTTVIKLETLKTENRLPLRYALNRD